MTPYCVDRPRYSTMGEIKTYFLGWQTCSSMVSTQKGCDDAQCAICVQQAQERRQPEAVAVAGVAAGVAAAAP